MMDQHLALGACTPQIAPPAPTPQPTLLDSPPPPPDVCRSFAAFQPAILSWVPELFRRVATVADLWPSHACVRKGKARRHGS